MSVKRAGLRARSGSFTAALSSQPALAAPTASAPQPRATDELLASNERSGSPMLLLCADLVRAQSDFLHRAAQCDQPADLLAYQLDLYRTSWALVMRSVLAISPGQAARMRATNRVT